jgi:hypothetical protein
LGFIVRKRLELGLLLTVLMSQTVALRAAEPRPVQARDPWVPELAVEKYQLGNGLTVVLHEDHKTPLVAVNVIYNVGSKDDPPGLTGIAHVFEHLMFKGSQHDRMGSDDLSYNSNRQCTGTGALARGRSHGFPFAGGDSGQARQRA